MPDTTPRTPAIPAAARAASLPLAEAESLVYEMLDLVIAWDEEYTRPAPLEGDALETLLRRARLLAAVAEALLRGRLGRSGLLEPAGGDHDHED